MLNLQPMLAKPIEWGKEYLDRIIKDPGLALEEKIDGHRIMLDISKNESRAFNRRGGISQWQKLFSSDAWQSMWRNKLSENDRIVIDGELISGTLHVFDLPYASAVPIHPKMQWRHRREHLEALSEFSWKSSLIKFVPSAQNESDKIKLIDWVLDSPAEGLMVKHMEAPYESGVRSDAWIKLKFTKTADVVVTQINMEGKSNAAVAMLGPEGELIEFAHVSTLHKEPVKVGDVIEVRYLYLGSNNRFVQPVYIRKRTDKASVECTIDQVGLVSI